MVNIIIDFLMYIHDYTSSRIHLTNIENYQDIIENIINGNEKETKETKENKNKTERSVKTNELIDYIFNSYDLEKETQAIFKKIEYEDIKKQELVENENKNKARAQYLLLLFYSKIKISIVFLRIVMFRKIVNCLLTDIIDKNKNKLKKTYKKYIDVLKPKDIRSKFFII